MVTQNDIAARPENESGVEPAVGELRHLLHDAAAGDIDAVLSAFLTQHIQLWAGNGDRFFHEGFESVFPLAGRRHPLQEIFRENDEPHRPFIEIANAKIYQLAVPFQILVDIISRLRHVDFRLHDEGGVFLNFLAHKHLLRGKKPGLSKNQAFTA